MTLTVYMEFRGVLEDREGNLIKRLDGDNMAVYQDAISESLALNPAFAFSQDFKDFTKGSDYETEKVNRMEVRVGTSDGAMYGRMRFFSDIGLTQKEQEELGDFMSRQYAKGWGNRFRELPIPVTEGIVRIQADHPYTEQFLVDLADHPENLGPKYWITEIRHPLYPKLKRIQALRDVNQKVRRGDFGGCVEREWNLDQQGTSWIYPNAVCRNRARVQQDAQLFQYSQACDHALVTGKTQMWGESSAEGNAYISDAWVEGDTLIAGDAIVQKDPNQTGAPILCKSTRVYGTVVGGVHLLDEVVAPEECLRCPEKRKKEIGKKKVAAER